MRENPSQLNLIEKNSYLQGKGKFFCGVRGIWLKPVENTKGFRVVIYAIWYKEKTKTNFSTSKYKSYKQAFYAAVKFRHKKEIKRYGESLISLKRISIYWKKAKECILDAHYLWAKGELPSSPPPKLRPSRNKTGVNGLYFEWRTSLGGTLCFIG